MVDVVTAEFAPLFAMSLMVLIPGFLFLMGSGMAYVRGHRMPMIFMGFLGSIAIVAAIAMVNYTVETPSTVLTMRAVEEHYGVEFTMKPQLPEKDGADIPAEVLILTEEGEEGEAEEVRAQVYVRHTNDGKVMLMDAENFGVEFSVDEVLLRQQVSSLDN